MGGFFSGLIHLTDWGFELQLVPPDITFTALKRGNIMTLLRIVTLYLPILAFCLDAKPAKAFLLGPLVKTIANSYSKKSPGRAQEGSNLSEPYLHDFSPSPVGKTVGNLNTNKSCKTETNKVRHAQANKKDCRDEKQSRVRRE